MDSELIQATSRIAVTDIEWEYFRAVDLFALFQSFTPHAGCLKAVEIYKSTFGVEMELKPPSEINRMSSDARKAMKYAVLDFDSPVSAHTVYEACDGHEIEMSGIVLNLRYVPVDMTFEPERKVDVCFSIPPRYDQPLPIQNLSASPGVSEKKASWDTDDVQRISALEKAFHTPIDELCMEDLDAYIEQEHDSDDERMNSREKLYRQLLMGEVNEPQADVEPGVESTPSDVDAVTEHSFVVTDPMAVQTLHQELKRKAKQKEATTVGELRRIRGKLLRKETAKEKRARGEEKGEEEEEEEESVPSQVSKAEKKMMKKQLHKRSKQTAAALLKEKKERWRLESRGIHVMKSARAESSDPSSGFTCDDERFQDKITHDPDFHADVTNPEFRKLKKFRKLNEKGVM